MKKLILLSCMVMFSLSVFSTNNETSNNEPTKKECEQKWIVEKEECSDATEKNIELKNSNQVSQETKENIKQIKDRQCGGSYTEGISNVDFIEYIPDLRLWLS